MNRQKILALIAITALMTGVSACRPAQPDHSAAFEELALKIGQAEQAIQDQKRSPFDLPDHSIARLAQIEVMRQDALEALSAIDPEMLDAADARRHARMTQAYRNFARMTRFGHGDVTHDRARPYVVTPFSGDWLEVAQRLTQDVRFSVLADAQDYLTAIDHVGQIIDDERRRFEADASRGVLPPRRVLVRAINDIEAVCQEDEAGETIWSRALLRELDALNISDADTVTALTRAAKDTIKGTIAPAYARLADALRSHLETAPEAADALRETSTSKAPIGFYEAALPLYTGKQDDLAILQAEAMAQSQDLQAATANLIAGLVDADIPPQQGYLEHATQQRALFADQLSETDSLRDVARQWLDIASDNQEAVTTRPMVRPTVRLTLQTVGSSPEALRLGHFRNSASLHIAIPRIDELSESQFALDVFGFGIPGQALLAKDAAAATANTVASDHAPFVAAWRAYAEDLASEQAWLTPSTEARLDYLVRHQRRATLMAADIGLNAGDWSWDETADFIQTYGYYTPPEADTVLLRLASLPGEAIAAPFGRQIIRRLRQEARTAMGNAFSFAAFNEIVLGDGPRPWVFVEADVRAWINRTRPNSTPLPVNNSPRLPTEADPDSAVSQGDGAQTITETP